MMEDDTSHLAVLMLDLHIPEAGSLKGKRHVIKSLKDRIRGSFNVSVAELGELDKWQRTVLGVAMIGNNQRVLNQAMEAILSFVNSSGGVELIESHLEFL